MRQAVITGAIPAQPNPQITEAVTREQSRLRNFIRSRVPDPEDAEEILQDVFYELTEAYHLMKPIEQVGAWLFRVARNRITDLLRKKKPEQLPDVWTEEGQELTPIDLWPSPDAGPDDAYARTVIVERLTKALDELPREQRDVFIAHEIDGRSFKELSAELGISVNTLLSRKRYAVLQLRQSLRDVYKEVILK